MNKGCWKLDDNEEAIFIDIDEEGEEEENVEGEIKDGVHRSKSKWAELPDLLLEKIFSYLSIREKYYASLVCRSWHRAFYLQNVWANFVLEDTTLTRGKFNYYSGWQYVLDHLRTQTCLSQVGRSFRYLTFEPMINFYNLYEFMNMISWYVEQSEKSNFELRGIGCNIHTLKFTFPCNMNSREDDRIRLFGTGGKLLAALKRLMGNLKKLKRLYLIDLMLDPREAVYLLDEVCDICCLTLQTLVLINTTRVPCHFLHVGVLLNLQVLHISPQNLGEDTVYLLGHTKLKHLHIIQNRYTPNDSSILPVSPKVWKECKKNNKNLSVHLEVEAGNREKEVLWQVQAPVKSVVYNSSLIKLTSESLMNVIDLYRTDLRVYGHLALPRFHMEKSFHERTDSLLLLLCRQCPFLHTLVSLK